jgi:hypothetical protein
VLLEQVDMVVQAGGGQAEQPGHLAHGAGLVGAQLKDLRAQRVGDHAQRFEVMNFMDGLVFIVHKLFSVQIYFNDQSIANIGRQVKGEYEVILVNRMTFNLAEIKAAGTTLFSTMV